MLYFVGWKQIVKQMTETNPFVFNRPVENPKFLLGRGSIFRWIDQILGGAARNQAFVVSGSPGSGKTSILHNLTLLTSLNDFTIIQIDARDLNRVNSGESTWRLIKSFNRSLSAQSLFHPSAEKPRFVLQPERVFIKEYWEPLKQSEEIRKFLLVIDNMELLTSEMNIGQDLKRKREFLWSLIRDYDNVEMLFGLQGRPELYSSEAIYPFTIASSIHLQFLTKDETTALLNMPDQYTIPGYVCDYIFRLTRGHPADVQRLAYQIFERSIESGYRLITVADVLAILSSELKGGDFYQPVYVQRENTKLVYSPRLNSFEFVNDKQQS
ncbi:MAG: hypothetical protein BMS9Abin02_0008 [Anaerolineae bacterium]|nr:MAG: hypothetical protein BMS9Abin02_0008 [Anaerolineae bacterium]